MFGWWKIPCRSESWPMEAIENQKFSLLGWERLSSRFLWRGCYRWFPSVCERVATSLVSQVGFTGCVICTCQAMQAIDSRKHDKKSAINTDFIGTLNRVVQILRVKSLQWVFTSMKGMSIIRNQKLFVMREILIKEIFHYFVCELLFVVIVYQK